MKKNKKIVVLGGGNAMPKTVLEGLKKYPVKISVISAVLDSGGSAGRERELFKTRISFGDFRRAALALSEETPEHKERIATRFQEGPLGGHVMINVSSTASVVPTNNFEKSFGELEEDIKEDLKIPNQHQLIFATHQDATLCTELDNGEIVEGEGSIDAPKHDGKLGIKRIFLEPEATASPKALSAIKKADLIVIGPGDLFSSLAQILLLRGIPEALLESKAKKVYICNLMTKNGETNGFSVLNFVGEIEKMLQGSLDYVIYNKFAPRKETFLEYKKRHPQFLELVAVDNGLPKNKFLGGDLIKEGVIEHDTRKISQILTLLI